MRKIKGYGVGDRAVIGKLRRLDSGVSFARDIVLCDREVDASDIFSLPEDVCGLVAVGERTDAAAVAVRAKGMSAVFISEEDAEGISEGERAVIYPERDTVFIAPKIEIVDDFSTRMRAELGEIPEERVQLLDCRELFSGKVGMRAMLADATVRGEEGAFEVYKQAAEACELQGLVILLSTSELDGDSLRAHLSGAIRAGVYTKLILAVSVRGICEYERVMRLIKSIVGELRETNAEIPEHIACGVVINKASEAVCAEEYSRAADIVVIECTSLLGGVCEAERASTLCGYIDVIFERMSGSVGDVVLSGDKELLKKCLERELTLRREPKRSYFLLESENIK